MKWLIAEKSIRGKYSGKYCSSQDVTVEIRENHLFNITNKDIDINGTWEYDKAYNEYHFLSDSFEIYLEKKKDNQLVLKSNINTDCGKLDQLILKED